MAVNKARQQHQNTKARKRKGRDKVVTDFNKAVAKKRRLRKLEFKPAAMHVGRRSTESIENMERRIAEWDIMDDIGLINR